MRCDSEARNRKLMTNAELCAALRVSHETLLKYRTQEEDPLPALRCGRRWLYDWRKVEKWLERQGKRALKARTG